MLAEVRKYGESLIIVDQIPEKLASEVLKNTNTKIIHKLFARDDKEAVGDTMLMDDKQKKYLSSLETGHAIVFSEHTPKPIHIAVDKSIDTSSEIPDDILVQDCFNSHKNELGKAYSPLENQTIILFDEFKTMYENFKKNLNTNHQDALREMVNNALPDKEDAEKKELMANLFLLYYRKKGQCNSSSPEKIKENVELLTEIFFDHKEITPADKMILNN